MSYVDATTIPEAWEKATFVRQTQSGRLEARLVRPRGEPRRAAERVANELQRSSSSAQRSDLAQ